MHSRSASVADASASASASARGSIATSGGARGSARRASVGWAAGPGTLSLRIAKDGTATAATFASADDAAAAAAPPGSAPTKAHSRHPSVVRSDSPPPASVNLDMTTMMAVAAAAAAMSSRNGSLAAAPSRPSHSRRSSAGARHSRGASSSQLQLGTLSSMAATPLHSPAHAKRLRDRGSTEAYRAVVSWALDPTFPLEQLCADAAAPIVRPWRWLLCAMPIFALYVAADVFSGLALPLPSFSGDDFDAFVTGGWLAHYVGMVCFLAGLIGVFFRRHPYHARFLLLFTAALVLFVLSSVLHTSRLIDADSIFTSGGHSVRAVQLSWLANILNFVVFSALVYRAPTSALKSPHKDDREKLETLLEIRRAELLRLQRLAEIDAQERLLRERQTARDKEEAEKRAWYAARKASRRAERGDNGEDAAEAQMVLADVEHSNEPACMRAAAAAASPTSIGPSSSSSSSAADPLARVRVVRSESDSPMPAPAAAAVSGPGEPSVSALSPGSCLSTFSLPLPSSYLGSAHSAGSSLIHYTMPSATASVSGAGVLHTMQPFDEATGTAAQGAWNTPSGLHPSVSAANSRNATAPATPARGSLQLQQQSSAVPHAAPPSHLLQLRASPDGDPLSAGWASRGGHHRGNGSSGGSADLHFYSPAPPSAQQPKWHHHSRNPSQSQSTSASQGDLQLQLHLVGPSAMSSSPLHVVYDESPMAPSPDLSLGLGPGLSPPPFPVHHPEMARVDESGADSLAPPALPTAAWISHPHTHAASNHTVGRVARMED